MVSCDAFNFPYQCRADTVTRGIRCYITGAQLAAYRPHSSPEPTRSSNKRLDVRKWHKADVAKRPSEVRASTLSLVAVGLGISLVPASLRHLYVDGVVYRRLGGYIQPKAPLDLASRRGDPSVVVQHFLKMVRQAAKNSRVDESERRGRTR